MSAELDLRGLGRLVLYEPPPFRILYVEDDPTHARSTVENLKERGLTSVDVAANATEASEKVAETAYDVVMADVVLDNAPQVKGPDKQGDEWLMDNLELLRGVKCAVVTGRRRRLVDYNKLKAAGIRVVEKGNPALEFFTELEEDARRKTTAINERVSAAVQDVLTGKPSAFRQEEKAAGDALADAAASTLSKWVESLADADTQDLVIAGRMMSPREVMKEIAKRTPIGRRILRMCIREMAAALGLPEEEEEEA